MLSKEAGLQMAAITLYLPNLIGLSISLLVTGFSTYLFAGIIAAAMVLLLMVVTPQPYIALYGIGQIWFWGPICLAFTGGRVMEPIPKPNQIVSTITGLCLLVIAIALYFSVF